MYFALVYIKICPPPVDFRVAPVLTISALPMAQVGSRLKFIKRNHLRLEGGLKEESLK
jgi:hypothetical protein